MTSELYRRVWRWHFYAGLVCLPVLVLMAATGALYLFRNEIEDLVYRDLRTVDASRGPSLDPSVLIARAEQAAPGRAVRFTAPSVPGRSAEVGVRTSDGMVAVHLDPADGRVLGTLADRARLMDVVKRLHSLAIAGPIANHGVEIVAGWAIVLVVSGVFLWWPRGRTGGVVTVRGSPSRRTWWRDVHAVTGVVAAVAILFLAVTGMPWSAFWGQQFGRLTEAAGIGMPKYRWGATPQSTRPDPEGAPWTVAQAPFPASDPHAGHDGAMRGEATARAMDDIGIDRAVRVFAELGIPTGTPVRLPEGPRGVYTAVRFPDDVTQERVVHLDRYSGRVLADARYADYGIAGKATEWGIGLHTGRQFGLSNQLVMLAGCLAIVMLAVSAVVMWWKRRPSGRLAAPPRVDGDRVARGAVAVAVILGLVYPLLGASMIAVLVIDRARVLFRPRQGIPT